MKKSRAHFSLATLAIALTIFLQAQDAPLAPRGESPRPASPEQMRWFRDAKLGLFIHWGPCSVKGVEISWARKGHPHDHPGHESVPPEEYDQLYKQFNPVKFDADAWMKLAREAGCKYVVIITKHHDGFSMWPTRQVRFTDPGRPEHYSIADTPFQRDICREIADAAHRHGLKLGWYYSTRDWTHPEYLVGDNGKYNDYYHNQIRELLSSYGTVDMLWFDHVAGNWRDYRFKELFQIVYGLQPDILVNNRAAAFIRPTSDQPGPGVLEFVRGDYDTPEQRIGAFQHGRAWESCVTMTRCDDGGGWSHRPDGKTRSLQECIQMLVSTVTGDGNLLLNVGPTAAGEILPEQIENLKGMGGWLAKFGESIYGTRGGPWVNGRWGGSTYKGDKVWLHIFTWPGETIRLTPIQEKVTAWRALTGGEAKLVQSEKGLDITLARAQQDPVDTIIELKLDRPVTAVQSVPAVAE